MFLVYYLIIKFLLTGMLDTVYREGSGVEAIRSWTSEIATP
jgi:hypothetical protein